MLVIPTFALTLTSVHDLRNAMYSALVKAMPFSPIHRQTWPKLVLLLLYISTDK